MRPVGMFGAALVIFGLPVLVYKAAMAEYHLKGGQPGHCWTPWNAKIGAGTPRDFSGGLRDFHLHSPAAAAAAPADE